MPKTWSFFRWLLAPARRRTPASNTAAALSPSLAAARINLSRQHPAVTTTSIRFLGNLETRDNILLAASLFERLRPRVSFSPISLRPEKSPGSLVRSGRPGESVELPKQALQGDIENEGPDEKGIARAS